MGISKALAFGAKTLFSKPSAQKNICKNIGFALGIGYATANTLRSGVKLYEKNQVDKASLLDATVGFSVAAGSIFGAGGAILAGTATKILVENCKSKVA